MGNRGGLVVASGLTLASGTAERDGQQPRTLAGAFARAVTGEHLMDKSIDALSKFRKNIDAAHGPAADASVEMKLGGDTTLSDIVAFFRDEPPCLAS